MLRKPHGMPVLLVLAVILLLSGCTADTGVGPQGESADNSAAPTAAATALLEEAVERREAIVNTATEIVWSDTFTPGETYTGTAYYVSNQGDDGNDGLSPETAWATLARVNQASLAYGDAVFFERGCIVGVYNTGDASTGYGAGIQRLAGGMGGGNHGTRFQNNYVHHMYHAGGGIETFEEQGFESGSVYGVQFVGNLFYQCSSGLTFFNWDEEPNPERKFVDCIYEDNWVLFTGLEDWMDQSFSPAFSHEGGPNLQEGCAIRNNVFFVARSTIVYIQKYVEEYFPDFEGNTYVQYADIPLIHCDSENLETDIYDPQAAMEVLGDESGTVILLNEDIWSNRLE